MHYNYDISTPTMVFKPIQITNNQQSNVSIRLSVENGLKKCKKHYDFFKKNLIFARQSVSIWWSLQKILTTAETN